MLCVVNVRLWLGQRRSACPRASWARQRTPTASLDNFAPPLCPYMLIERMRRCLPSRLRSVERARTAQPWIPMCLGRPRPMDTARQRMIEPFGTHRDTHLGESAASGGAESRAGEGSGVLGRGHAEHLHGCGARRLAVSTVRDTGGDVLAATTARVKCARACNTPGQRPDAASKCRAFQGAHTRSARRAVRP